MQSVAALEHEIADVARHVLVNGALHAIDERDRFASRRGCDRAPATAAVEAELAAGARIDRALDAAKRRNRRSPCASSGSDRRALAREGVREPPRRAPCAGSATRPRRPMSRPKASSVRRISSAAPGTVRVVIDILDAHEPLAAVRRAHRPSSRRRPRASRSAAARWARARIGLDSSRKQRRRHERILEALHEPLERLALLSRAPRDAADRPSRPGVAATRGCAVAPTALRARRSIAAGIPRRDPRRAPRPSPRASAR